MTRSETRTGRAACELARSVARLVDGRTKHDRRLRRSILISAAFVGAWMML